jgi:hypothetical protein
MMLPTMPVPCYLFSHTAHPLNHLLPALLQLIWTLPLAQ